MWKVYVGYCVVFGLIGVVYLVGGNLIGIAWLALAAAWVFLTGYVRRRSRTQRIGPGDRQKD